MEAMQKKIFKGFKLFWKFKMKAILKLIQHKIEFKID